MSWLVESSWPHGNRKCGDKKERKGIVYFPLNIGLIGRQLEALCPEASKCSCYIASPKPQLREQRPPCLVSRAPSMPLTNPKAFPSFPSVPSTPAGPSPLLTSPSCPSSATHLFFAAAPLQHLWLLDPPRPADTKYWPRNEREIDHSKTCIVLELCRK